MTKWKLAKVDQKLNKFLANYDKKTKVQLLIAASGILVFLLIAGTVTFNHGLFSQFYSKPLSHAATTLPPVPAHYSTLFTYMQGQLNAFQTTLDQQNTGTLSSVITSTDLLQANGNSGTTLIQASNPNLHCTDNLLVMCSVNKFLDRMQELGVQAMVIAVKYPLLSDNMSNLETPPGSEGTTAQYLQFYNDVAVAIRAHGMKVAVETNAIFSGTSFTTFTYNLPNFCDYEADNHLVTQKIIDNLHPDYLQIFQEPDTQFALTSYPQFDPKSGTAGITGGAVGASRYIKAVLGSAVDPSCPANPDPTLTPINKGTTKIMAGTGTWLMTDQTSSHTNYAQSFSQISTLDGIDIHVYPVVNDGIPQPTYTYLQNILTMSDIAHNAGKRVTMMEAWANKEDPTDLGAGSVASSAKIFDRDNFSFWQPIDQQFISEMLLAAKIKNIELINPFWSKYFVSYLDYTPGTYDENTTSSALNTAEGQAVGQNLTSDTFSPTGLYLKQLLSPNAASFSLTSTAISPLAPTATFSAQLKTRTDTDASNLFTAKITFPASLVQVQSITTTGSFVTNWVDTSFDNTAGTISIIGGVSNPGFETTGTDALMATINFRTTSGSGGAGNIAFDTSTGKSAIYRNSDNINILSSTSPLSLTVSPASSPSPSPTALPFLNFCNCAGKNPRIKNITAVQGGARAHFSYNNSQIIFDRPTTTGFYDVFVANMSSPLTTAVNITQPTAPKIAQGLPQRNRSDATFSPSGQFVVFKAEADNHYLVGQSNPNGNGFDLAFPGYGGFSDFWATDPTGTTFWKLTNYPIKQSANDGVPIKGIMDPTFSDDGKTLYWAESTQPNGVNNPNWVIKSASFNVDGNGVPSLSNNQGVLVYDPATMATLTGQNPLYVNVMGYIDSDTLLIAGNPTGLSQFGMDEYLLHISSHTLTNLTNSPNDWDEGSDLTANKRAVVYMTNKDSIYTFDQTKSDWHNQLMQRDYDLVNIDGTGQERLTYFNDPTAPEYIGHNALVIDPAISPDGKYLLANVGVDFSATTSPTRNYQFELVLLTLEANFPAPVVGPSPTPSPTASPTHAPTPTPTPSPSPSPTPSPTPVPIACSLSSASWSNLTANPVVSGTSISLTVNSIGDCSGKTVSFVINQDNGILPAGSASINPLNSVFVGNTATTTWVSEYQPDGPFGIFDPPEYYFTATLTSSTTGTSSVKSTNPELLVNNSGNPNPSTAPSGPGDGNKDGVVNLTDLSVLLSNFAKISSQPDFPTGLDINNDGIINSIDFSSEINLLKTNTSI